MDNTPPLSLRLTAFFAAIVLTFFTTVSGAAENLDELMARQARYAINPWPTNLLENASNNYIWQPETVMYQDVTTGHEVWVLIRAPNFEEIYSTEHGSNVWSYDGSRIGFFSLSRPTANTSLGSAHRRWIVNSDGSNLKAAEGYGRSFMPFEGFGWAHTENAYYAFGNGSPEPSGSALYNLYKMSVGVNNIVTGSFILDTSSANTYWKDIVKEGISGDDSWIVARDNTTHAADSSCNVTNTREMYFIRLGSTPQLVRHWGIARGTVYGTHTFASESQWHDVWAPGLDPENIIGQYESDPATMFVSMVRSGSCADGGPVFQAWNGTSFGNDEVRPISYTPASTTNPPYSNPYFGHPVFDRWGHYSLLGNNADSPTPGTMIYDVKLNKMVWSNYVFNYGQYDATHKSWSGWTDYVISGTPAQDVIMTNKWNQSYQNAINVAYTHYNGGNYNAYPRPGQSPDGTKVAFSQQFLNTNSLSYITWAVVYYPKPPVNLNAQANGSNVRVSWNRPSYTTRGWPNEATDAPPKAREIKGYHVWQSDNGQGGWREITLGATPAEYIDIQLPNGTVKYYAVTSEEFSRLESRQLSAIIQVSVDSGGAVTSSQFAPQGQAGFWTTPPSAPSNFTSTALPTPGQYQLAWAEPSDSKIRYYNIYYSNAGTPPTDQQHRIASVPTGTNGYIDWLADSSQPAYYRITSVDRQGNEGSAPQTVRLSPPTLVSVQ